MHFTSRSFVRCAVLLALSAATAVVSGCASTSGAQAAVAAVDDDKLVDDAPFARKSAARSTAPRVMPTVRSPRTEAGARRLLQAGLHAMHKDDFALAAAAFDAVLRSDLLTENGRLNLYWMAADAHRQNHNLDGEASALGAFVMQAQVLDDDGDRSMRALARLRAMKVQQSDTLGRSKSAPILVWNVRESASIMAEVSCGAEHNPQLLDERVESVDDGHTRLLRRSARCGDGPRVELWFDVTEADAPAAARQR